MDNSVECVAHRPMHADGPEEYCSRRRPQECNADEDKEAEPADRHIRTWYNSHHETSLHHFRPARPPRWHHQHGSIGRRQDKGKSREGKVDSVSEERLRQESGPSQAQPKLLLSNVNHQFYLNEPGGTIRTRRTRLVRPIFLLFIILCWCFVKPVATAVPLQCGKAWPGWAIVNPHGGLTASLEECRGYYTASPTPLTTGFKTQCGDGYTRGGGCEMSAAAAFSRYDTTGDGMIEAAEAWSLLHAMGIDGNNMGAEFENVDRNHDGKMTLAEWRSFANIQPKIGMWINIANKISKGFEIESADFGALFRENPQNTYMLREQKADPANGCTELKGLGDIYKGKIVLVDGGDCDFCQKAKMAQDKLASAIIVVSIDETLERMQLGTCGLHIEIPAFMIRHSVGASLKAVTDPLVIDFPTCYPTDYGSIAPGHGLETCDDHNTVSGDGCSAQCIRECGDNVLDGHETCDDGNLINGDGCSPTCSLEQGFAQCSQIGCQSVCGDGIRVGLRILCRTNVCSKAVGRMPEGCESSGEV